MKTKMLIERVGREVTINFSGPLNSTDILRLAQASEMLEQMVGEMDYGPTSHITESCLEIERLFNLHKDESTQLSFEGWPK